ncbi:hypothetical protein KI387_002304, partial [Taxus chinensis]
YQYILNSRFSFMIWLSKSTVTMGELPGELEKTIALFIITFFLIYYAFISMMLVCVEGCPPMELRALLTFKTSLIDGWDNLLNSWEDCCVRSGVGCDKIESKGHVTNLDLSDLGLSSVSDMSWSSIIGSLSRLKHLSLSSCNLLGSTFPVSLTNLSSLVFLDLSDNEISGSLPISIGNLCALTDLYLGHNELSGSLPLSFAKLSALTGCD